MLEKMNIDKSSDLTFWASNIHYMNDPHEMDFLYDELHRVLPELEKELAINEHDIPFSAFNFSHHSSIGLKLDLDNDLKEKIYNTIYKNVYAISFSRKNDYLPMWSLYGNKGGGLCLEFDYEKLNSYYKRMKKEDLAKRLIEIKYDIKDSEIWQKIKDFYQEYHAQIKINKGIDSFQLRSIFIARVLLEFSLLMKHQTYSYEEEIRLVDHVVMIDDLGDLYKKVKVEPLHGRYKKASEPHLRVKNGLLIPYKEIKIPVSCLTSVIVGPTMNSKLQCEAMKTLLKSTKKIIEVVPSSVPFRLL